jgi:hypothetical protein
MLLEMFWGTTWELGELDKNPMGNLSEQGKKPKTPLQFPQENAIYMGQSVLPWRKLASEMAKK